MLDYKELQSKVIDLLRFPLIVAVVFIHGVGKDIFNNFNFIPSNDFILLTNFNDKWYLSDCCTFIFSYKWLFVFCKKMEHENI